MSKKECIYRYMKDVEVTHTETSLTCPYCQHKSTGEDMDTDGETYDILCDTDDGGCGKTFSMYFSID